MNLKKIFKSKTDFILVLLVLIIVGLILFNIYQILNVNNQKNTPTENYSNTNSSINVENSKIGEIINCFSRPPENQQKCFDDFMLNYLEGKTTGDALSDLELARLSDSNIENNCHPIVHSIGRITYQKIGNVGDAFEACDQTCHSGCFHGVMERLFYSDNEIDSGRKHLEYEDMEDKIPGICDPEKFNNPDNAVIFQCLHGVGHAILYSLDYDLDTSLKSCDLLASTYERSSCYGGVVMENVTAFDKAKRDIKREDPLYPCNKLDAKYQNDCYMMQTSLMFEYGLPTNQIAQECYKTGQFQAACFTSLGRDLSNYVRLNNSNIAIEACEVFSVNYESSCIAGTIFALVDNTWDGRFAYPFCNKLNNQKNKENCFSQANNYLQYTYTKNRAQIEEQCNLYAGSDKEICVARINQ